MEVGDHDQYIIKVDGSGRLTKRNRRFLRVFKPVTMTIENTPVNNKLEQQITSEPRINDVVNWKPEPNAVTMPYNDNTQTMPDPVAVPISPPKVPASRIEEPASKIKGPKVPAMLKRLLPFNSDGLSEGIVAPEEGGRNRRKQILEK